MPNRLGFLGAGFKVFYELVPLFIENGCWKPPICDRGRKATKG